MKLSEVHEACRLIEQDGVEAFETVRRMHGHDVALVLVVAHLRQTHGARETFPADRDIDEQVNQVLRAEHIV